MSEDPILPDTIDALGDAVIALLRRKARALDLSEGMIGSIRPRGPVVPARLPVLDLLAPMVGRAGPETLAVVEALVAAAHDLAWRQTYSEADGFARTYLDRYGWFDLAGPEGPYRAEGIRIMMGCWGEGLVYPNHTHPPEEHYLVLAGGARFRLGSDPYRRLGPGEVFHTPAGEVHSADMRGEALIALSIWRAGDLRVRIGLTDSERQVALDD